MSNSLPYPSIHRKSRTPEVIRTFVAQRAAAGMPLDLLAQLVGVSYHTVFAWCKKEILANDGEMNLTAAQLRERNKQLARNDAQLRILEVRRAAHETAVEAQKLAAVRAESRKARLASRAEANKLAAVRSVTRKAKHESRAEAQRLAAARSESMQAKHEAAAMAKKLDAVSIEARKVKSEIRAKGLQILASEGQARLAELRNIAVQQDEFRKQHKIHRTIRLAEDSATRHEKAHALVNKVRSLNPTALNMHRIAVELGVSVDDIFAAYRLTNQRFKP